MIRIDALPAFSDNYIWLLQDDQSRQCCVVDPGDAAPVLSWLQQNPQWQLTDILVTHHHRDHTGGIEPLKAQTGARVIGPAREAISGRDLAVDDGDSVTLLGRGFQVIGVPGHTLGHVAYHQQNEQLLFSGDTLFAAGCGRIFEGTPAQMHDSLQKLARLPAQTQVYCAHEYTLSNLRFAQAVEPDNAALAQRQARCTALRERQQITLPSTLAEELATNPFLRVDQTEVIAAAERQLKQGNLSETQVFAAIRGWKDHFQG